MNTKNRVIRNYSNLTAAIYGGLFLLVASCKKNSFSTSQSKNIQTQQHTLQQNASPKVYHRPAYNPTPSKNGIPDAQTTTKSTGDKNVPEKIQQNTIYTTSPLNTAPLNKLNTDKNDVAKVSAIQKDTTEINNIVTPTLLQNAAPLSKLNIHENDAIKVVKPAKETIETNTQQGVMYQAVLDGDVDKVKELLRNKAININAPVNEPEDHKGLTFLHLAVMYGYINIIYAIVNHSGIDLNSRNEEESTALHLAAKRGQSEVINILIYQNNIDLNAQNQEGSTALHCAVKSGNKPSVTHLIKRPGIKLDVEDKNGNTPCELAAIHKNRDLIYKDIAKLLQRKNNSRKT